MLVFQDGSTHRWLPDTEAQQDLIVTLDDATGHITSTFLTDQEGTMSRFRGLSETIGRYGLFSAFYTDRGSHYFLTPAAGGRVDTLCLQEDRQVGRENCVSWRGSSLHIPQQAHRHHYVRATIRVHEYPDARLAIFGGPRCLARNDADANPAAGPVKEAA